MRLVRALYCFQLYCNLFGVSRCRSVWDRSRWDFDDDSDIFKMFLCIYESWEIEEIACIYKFAEGLDRIFSDIYHDLTGAFDFDSEWNRECLLGGTLSRGLELLQCVFQIKDHTVLVSTMQERIEHPTLNFQDESLDDTTHDVRQQELQELGEGWRGPSPFQGENEKHPPLSWTLTWRDFYTSAWLSETDGDIRRWGHIMWDAARLERTGAKDLLIRKEEGRWKGEEWNILDYIVPV